MRTANVDRRRLRLPAVVCLVGAWVGWAPTCEAQPFTNSAQLEAALSAQMTLTPLPPQPQPVVTVLVHWPKPPAQGLLRMWTKPTSQLPRTRLVVPEDSISVPGLYVGVTTAPPVGSGMPLFVYLVRVGDTAGRIILEYPDPMDNEIRGTAYNPSAAGGPGRDVLVRVPFVVGGGVVVFSVAAGSPTLIVARDFDPAPPPPRGKQWLF